MALSPEVEEHDCCEHPETENCFPIYIPNDDPFYSDKKDATCQEFTRSDAFCDSGKALGSPREQYSIVTSFVDGSQIYSANEMDARKLRSFKNGKLKTNDNYLREMLPEFDGHMTAGDMRALDMPGLATMQTLFLREHNRVAGLLAEALGEDDEQIYQKARRIVIAEYQNIVYNEYLPLILGPDSIYKYGLSIAGPTSYDPTEDPSLINSFATAAYRFGHTLIQGLVNMADVNDPESIVRVYQLRENFFNMDNYLRDNGLGMEQLMAGLIGQHAQRYDRFVTEDVTNFLFMHFGEDTGVNKKRTFGADLVARNIQRGRDHGLPGYSKYRQLCRLRDLPPFRTGSHPSEMSLESWKMLSEVYETPDDIDLFVGGLAEFSLRGGLSGPTFNCIKSMMFKRVLNGDRFFFTHQNQAGSFSPKQLKQLRRRTLRDVICENTEVAKARRNVFSLEGKMMDCGRVNSLDMNTFL